MDRRHFLKTMGAGAAALAVGRLSGAADGATKPNFLLIVTDDQRWDAMSVVQREQGDKGRFPWLKTPNLDRLAAEGVRFRNAFVVNALCAPSRASFMTGNYGHVNGIVNNHTPFNPDVTMASELGKAGYATAYIGKWHMGPQSGQRPTFGYSASFVGQGVYFDCPFEINGQKTATRGWVDDVSTDYASKFMRENKNKPFAMVLGFKTTHGPFEPPARHANAYEGEEARPVPNLDATAIYRRDANVPAGRGGKAGGRTNLGYFRTITAMDENVGKLLDLLDELKIADNTMVIFASDNGYYLGEHGLGDKRSAYDESLRIPLIVRYPRAVAKGKLAEGMALNIDVPATIMDYAGVTPSQSIHGLSLRPLLEDKSSDWRKAWFYCYFYENNFGTPTTTAVRTDAAKLIKYPGHDEWTELFELKADPYELKNLINDPAAASLRKELEGEYAKQAAAIAFCIPEFADNPAKDQPAAPLKAWVLDYRFDKDQGDNVVDVSAHGNHGTASGAPVVDGRDGRKARKFDGRGFIEVPKSKSLNPTVLGWTIEATIKPETPDGIILARGGETAGYCLYLQNGRPVFAVVSKRRLVTAAGKHLLGEGWKTLTAKITADRQLILLIDGQPVGKAKLRDFIAQDPNDTMQIGADRGSRVLGKETPAFVGLVESVRLYSGGLP